MAGALTNCPNCKSTLSLAQEMPANAFLRCPICQTTFAVRPAALAAAAQTAALPPAPPAAAPPPPLVPKPLMPKAAAAPPMTQPRRASAPSTVRPAPAAASPHANGKSVPRPASAASSSALGRIVGGLALAAMALLFVGGLAYLLYTQVFADRPAPNKQAEGPGALAVNTQPKRAEVPEATESPAKPAPAPTDPAKDPVPPIESKKKDNPAPKEREDVDIADLKKPKAPEAKAPLTEVTPKPAPPPEPPAKTEPEPKSKESPKESAKGSPTVPIVIPGTPAAPGVSAERVDAAIARGVQYLKNNQKPDGSWGDGRLGYAGLCGLALLECSVPVNDPVIQRAAQFVRRSVLEQNQTYDTSASILFLDRLGDKRDRELIRNLAFRLMASQNPCGGWGYTSAPVYAVDLVKMQGYLRTHFPFTPKQPRAPTGKADAKALRDPSGEPAHAAGGKNPDGKDTGRIDLLKLPVTELLWNKWNPYMLNPGDNSNTQFALLALWAARRHDVPVECAALLSYERYMRTQNGDGGWGYAGPIKLNGFPPHEKIRPGTPIPPGVIPPGFFPEGGIPGPGFGPMPPGPGQPPIGKPPVGMPPVIGQPGGLLAPPIPGVSPPGMPGMQGGGWGTDIKTTPTMTCVGLLGLAMGAGAVPSAAKGRDKADNPAIQNGLRLLAQHVGDPVANGNAHRPMQNLYLLWSIERVAVLYDLKTIGGKDWYGWGAQILLSNQGGDGSWGNGGYTGATGVSDTCFALLFLKRSNLVADLTEHLRLHMMIRDPGAR